MSMKQLGLFAADPSLRDFLVSGPAILAALVVKHQRSSQQLVLGMEGSTAVSVEKHPLYKLRTASDSISNTSGRSSQTCGAWYEGATAVMCIN